MLKKRFKIAMFNFGKWVYLEYNISHYTNDDNILYGLDLADYRR